MKARRKICNSSSLSLKREFLKKWGKGLEICRNMIKKDASILERKNAIKLSADVAMAATRNATTTTTRWRRALLNDVVSSNPSNEVLVERIVGRRVGNSSSRVIACSRRILRRSRRIGIGSRRRATRVVPKSSSIVKKLVKSRRSALQRVVPGGEELDGVSLLQETLDYIVSLRLQVHVMRHVAAAAAKT